MEQEAYPPGRTDPAFVGFRAGVTGKGATNSGNLASDLPVPWSITPFVYAMRCCIPIRGSGSEPQVREDRANPPVVVVGGR